MSSVNVFVDESGTIIKGTLEDPEYFVIALILTNNERFVKKVFTKKRLSVLKSGEKEILKTTKEVKGSTISEARKTAIYTSLVEKCSEHLEVGVIILDLKNADNRLKQFPSRAFNFLIARYLSTFYKKYSKFNDADSISFFVDERNVATGSKYTLEEYLNTEYNIEDPICNGDIYVQYLDSKNRNLIQLADFLANTCYRKFKKNDPDANSNLEILGDILCNRKIFYFPLPHIKK